MTETRKAEIRAFLQEIKQTLTSTRKGSIEHSWDLVRRAENVSCIAELGFNLSDVKDEILGLSVTDYCEGPVQDRDEPGDLWVFGKATGNREVYIKLKLATFGTIKRVRVISFHFARQLLCYPYKEEKGDETKA